MPMSVTTSSERVRGRAPRKAVKRRRPDDIVDLTTAVSDADVIDLTQDQAVVAWAPMLQPPARTLRTIFDRTIPVYQDDKALVQSALSTVVEEDLEWQKLTRSGTGTGTSYVPAPDKVREAIASVLQGYYPSCLVTGVDRVRNDAQEAAYCESATAFGMCVCALAGC